MCNTKEKPKPNGTTIILYGSHARVRELLSPLPRHSYEFTNLGIKNSKKGILQKRYI